MEKKLKFIFILILFLYPFLSFAQSKPLTVGIKILPELSTFVASFEEDKSRFSLSGGVQAIYTLSPRIEIESGIYYLDKGGMMGMMTSRDFRKAKLYYYYLSLPVQFRLKLGEKFYIAAGPSLEYFLNGKIVLTNGRSYELDLETKLNLGGAIAFGYVAPLMEMDNVKFFIEARMSPTFNDSFKIALLNYGLGVGLNYTLN